MSWHPPSRLSGSLVALALALSIVVTGPAGHASATATSELATAQRQLDGLQVEYAQAEQAYGAAVDRLAAAEQRAVRAVEEYERAARAVRQLQNAKVRWDGLDALLTRAAGAETIAALAQQQADEALRARLVRSGTLAAAKTALASRLVVSRKRVRQLTRQRSTLLKRLAAARRKSLAESASDAGAGAAVAFAIAQLGKPYEWAATGPSTFDCSGLTMRAWERGGATLVHQSAGQFRQAEPVEVAQLRPGDLVFFAADSRDATSIDHVGLYIGGDSMIEAPHPGATVRRASIWRTGLFGFARPRAR